MKVSGLRVFVVVGDFMILDVVCESVGRVMVVVEDCFDGW